MRKIIIVGTGGLASEITEYVIDNNSKDERVKVLGYCDTHDRNHSAYKLPFPFLGSEHEYQYSGDEEIVVAIANHKIRREVIDSIHAKKLSFYTFIHHSSLVAHTSYIGKGNIVCPNTIIGPKVILGDHNVVNCNVILGHDSEIGDQNVISPGVSITGNCKIGNSNFFGTSSSVIPGMKIGNNNRIKAGILVERNVKNGNLVFDVKKTYHRILYPVSD